MTPARIIQFDRLDEVRQVARARAVEDFEYFANHVLGAGLPQDVCELMQKQVEQSAEQFALIARSDVRNLEEVFNAWLFVLGLRPFAQLRTGSETFEWLFGQELRRAA